MLAALRDRTYRHLYLAQIVALLGTGLATVALGLLAYDIAGAAAGRVLGTALAIKMVAYVVVAPLANAVVARLPRRRVLIGADLTRLVVAASLPLVGEVWQVYVLVFVLQAASATFTPTFQSAIPEVLPDERRYTAALSLSRLAYDLEAVVSPALAAALLTVVTSTTLFFGTALGFAASALLVLSVAIPHRGADRTGAETPPTEAPFGERVRRGAVLFFRCPPLRPILALNLAVASAGAFVIVQSVVIVRSHLALPDGVVAWVLGANGLGSMLAAFALPALLRRVSERLVMLTGAGVLTVATATIPLALRATSPAAGLAAIVVTWVVIGVGWSSVETPVGRVIRRSVAADDLPAAFAAQFSLQHACWLVTYPLIGWLGAWSLSSTALVATAISAAATVGAVLVWPKTPRSDETPVVSTLAAS